MADDDIDQNGPPVRIDRRPRDDNGTSFDVPMRRRVGPEAWAPKLPPRDDPTSLDALLARYGSVSLSDVLTKRTSDKFEDRRGQPFPEFYSTTPENPTRPGTFNQLDDKRDQLVDALLRKYNVPEQQTWGGLKSYIPQEWRNQADSARTQIRDAIPPALWLALNGIRAPNPSLANVIRSSALPATEWPTHAAVRVGNRTFIGANHGEAALRAQDALGTGAFDRIAPGDADGFLTNTGRWVSREEAGRLADQRNATSYYNKWFGFGAPRTGKDAFLSEALELYDPKTGLEK